MCIEETSGRSPDCLSFIIDLKVTGAEIHMRFILMPPDHQFPTGLDPLDFVPVVPPVWGKIKPDVEFYIVGRIRGIKERIGVYRRSDRLFVCARGMIPDLFDWCIRSRYLCLKIGVNPVEKGSLV